MEGCPKSKWIGASAAALVAAMGVVSNARANDILDVTTSYVGGPAGDVQPFGPASPDSGVVTFTNNGSSTLTATFGQVALAGNGNKTIISPVL